MEAITIKAPAKINLFLEVGGKLENGYHLIQSVMQSVTLYDELTVSKSDKDSFFCSDNNLQDENNLVIKAKNAYFNITGLHFHTDIRLIKNIPVAAGLGGGSSDCAAMLIALNTLCGERLTQTELTSLGKTLGADVPFCIKKGICLAEGIGEILQELDPLPECYFVISIGNEKVSTKEAFKKLDSIPERAVKEIREFLNALKKRNLISIGREAYNVFEQNNCFRREIKDMMLSNNAICAMLSGSGPSVFGIFGKAEHALSAVKAIKNNGFKAYFCQPE